ncbi:hypothetical protein AVEN_5631-1 [Araneus ventricosus]|uniref:DNA helicase Pif1-like 2B domain-containing protein n=1 Tax=Araneus ventricosus TaxID=182803 RepID=A0A4Y2T1T7_ARAVE|nr:hypothetical protein AVEN_5631-1 [Araneus ventricosus]
MEINTKVLEFMPGNETVYKAVDMIMSEDPQDQLTFPEEFLNSLTPTGLPPYELKLKIGCIVMLLRNLAPSKGLCNGTRLIITKLQQNIIQAKSIDGTQTFLIPRIPLIPSQTNMPFKFKQIPERFKACYDDLNGPISIAQKLKLKLERAVNKIYGFGNQKMPALTSIGRIKAGIEADNVKAKNISIYIVPDDAQSFDLIIGRTWLDLPHIAYTKIGKRVHIGYRDDELFRNFPIDEKVNRVCLKRLETSQLENESLQIKDSSHQKMIGTLANDLKMVNNELRLLQGDIKDFKKERHSLLLQIQEKNKHVENLKSINDSLVKTNAYYDKKKSGKVSLRKGDVVAVRINSNTTGESTKTQPRYRGSMVVTEILPSDTYRISQLEPSNSRLYATTAHVRQLKAWRSWNEDNDDSSENSDDESEMQRPKRTIRKPVRYGAFMPDR